MFPFLSNLERSLCNNSFSVHVRMVAVSRFDSRPSEMGHVPCFRYHLPMLHRSLCRGFVFTFFCHMPLVGRVITLSVCLSVSLYVCACVRAYMQSLPLLVRLFVISDTDLQIRGQLDVCQDSGYTERYGAWHGHRPLLDHRLCHLRRIVLFGGRLNSQRRFNSGKRSRGERFCTWHSVHAST